ncbi:hypothetical protein [Lysinibacillus agricola]|uniref:hypothetical protein n=1 Tax=Lysinibacillus agricola TaxID=2590012 RepID=UPI003C1D0119
MRQNIQVKSGSFNFFQQMFLVAKAKRQLQKSLTSIGGEMNAVLSNFSAGVQYPPEA